MTTKKTKKPVEYEPDLSNPDEAFYEGYCLARHQIADAIDQLADSIRYGVSPEGPGKTPVKAPSAKAKKKVSK